MCKPTSHTLPTYHVTKITGQSGKIAQKSSACNHSTKTTFPIGLSLSPGSYNITWNRPVNRYKLGSEYGTIAKKQRIASNSNSLGGYREC